MNRLVAFLVALFVLGLCLVGCTGGAPGTVALTVTRPENGTVTSDPAGIECGSGGSDCSEAFDEGVVVTLTPAADEGFTFAGWGGDCSGSGECRISMNADKNVSASFTALPADSFSIQVTLEGTGEGTVTSTPAGIDCGSDCTEDFEEGTSVTLTATPADGSVFDTWSGDCSGSGACTLIIDSNKSVSAAFRPELFTDQFGTSAYDIAESVSVEGGAAYVVGETQGSFVGSNAGSLDVFFRKYNSNGNIEWTRQFGTVANDYVGSVAVAGEAIYIAGDTNGNLEGTSAGGYDAYLRRYNSNGEVEWTRQFGTSGADVANAVTVEGEAVYVVGYTAGNLGGTSSGGYDAFIGKYTSDGDIEWTRQFGTAAIEFANAVSVEGEAVYVVGYTSGNLAGTNAGLSDAFIRKYNSQGDLEWTRQFGTESLDTVDAVSAEGGAAYVVGATAGSFEGTNMGDYDAYVRKYDGDGEVEWTRQFGTSNQDLANSVSAEGGAVFIAGHTEGSLEGTSAGESDALLRKYTSDGEVERTWQFGTSSSESALSVDVDGRAVYLAGLAAGSLEGENAGSTDAFLRIIFQAPAP